MGPVASDYSAFDECSLVESARRDPNAFAEVYRRHVERIHAYAYRRSLSRSIAEDVTSATFEKALKGLPNYRWREPGIGPWLFRIASNELVNVYRLRDRQDRIVESMSGAAEEQLGSAGEWIERHDPTLVEALSKISPRYQRALTLRFFADLTNEEAAAALGVSRTTMAVIVHRGANALRRVLAQSDRTEVFSHE